MSKIPQAAFKTRNTKEAALLYSLDECKPLASRPALCVREEGKPVVYFFFEGGDLARKIHAAFEDKDFVEKHKGELPDELMPRVVALVKVMWHYWERLKEDTKDLPEHYVAHKGNKIIITPAPKKDK